tara:strand:- start:5164 stop:5793 length:630 start_codon:yes stop_codon:yes gene_type:complete
MEKENCLVKIIEKNNLSIKNNPYGTIRLWPYSYVELFYNSFCNKLYKINPSAWILEVNQENNLNLKIWDLFFNKPNIKNINLGKLKENKYAQFSKFDMIIIKNKYILNDQKTISNLINSLNSHGGLIIENIGRESKSIIQIYLKYFMKFKIDIYDFRYNRFILKNCLLLIEKKKNFSIFNRIKSLVLLFKFLLTEFFISFLLFTFRKKN